MPEHNGSTSDSVVPSAGFDYYKGTIYWNNFEETRHRENERISGDRRIDWMQHFKDTYGTFERALIINCGHGWVERTLYELGVVKAVVGLDCGVAALTTAKAEAARIGMPAEYICSDVNVFETDDLSFDLVVNHAAMHHVAFIDRVTRALRNYLTPNGRYLLYDYVGPDRNQYSWEVWSRMLEFNETLPERFRTRPPYAHLKTMLATDPTEAVHSAVQLDVLRRYFEVTERVDLGGGIAYTLMFENRVLFDQRNTPEGKTTVERLLDADREFLAEKPESNLFSYCVAEPLSAELDDPKQLAEWTAEEDAREERARANGGIYHPTSALEIIYNWIADLRYELQLIKGQPKP